ncbi:MAG: hypothetical protein A2857_05455 [Candidatus Levybacteria bacterium RIFCSPHIGHO2_01_FULL_36_15]|nr:MAG: hypothetical protein A2857_05455 [Candidatus Levybacteria bacterium RIFCSPHIGHO2_01_FULL_36_15]OGH38494.1 MAG: hypothetical protein A2905_01980 [Candidatus Levybacteria bacterium RIFCSPLOWO2_01_FULL_36_10]
MLVEARDGKTPNPEGLTPVKEMLSLQIFDVGAVQFRRFRFNLHETYPDAPEASVYFDLRLLRRFPDAKRCAVSAYQELVRPLKFDLFADIPTAASHFVSSLQDRFGVGIVTPRIDKKTHGNGNKIDGILPEDRGKIALPIDDVATHGTSVGNAAKILREEGLVVKDAIVLIDREQGAGECLEKQGIKLHSAFTLQQMIKYYLRMGRITQKTYDEIQENERALNKFLQEVNPV